MMTKTPKSFATACVALAGLLVVSLGVFGEEPEGTGAPFADEPAAHTLYQAMIDAMRDADSLRYVSEYRAEARGREFGLCTYTATLRKPNYARVEASRDGEIRGILVGDGNTFWIYWPNGRPRHGWEQCGEAAELYEKTRFSCYMRKPAPPGRHSIGHDVGQLGAGISMAIFDPSTFHGYTDSMQRYLDAIRGLGVEAVAGEDCDVIELSFMKYQRSWRLWLSQRDHLPRKLEQVVRVSYDITMREVWSDVTVNGEVPLDLFKWRPPKGWQEWEMPPLEEGLLKPGTPAPDFDLAALQGGRIKLSEHRGNIVWLNKWRAG
jgi:outer membrane lipoprotein-sorting protein